MTASKKNRRLLFICVLTAFGMFGFGFALVPLYNVFCKVTGVNGKTGGPVNYLGGPIDTSRTITVEFVATNNANMSWDFHPMTKKVELHPGEMKRISYFVHNESGKDMSVQAIPSVTPGYAARHLKKTECFCFTTQKLKRDQSAVWPILFHLETSIPKKVNTVTLSYTLFDLSKYKIKPRKESGRIS